MRFKGGDKIGGVFKTNEAADLLEWHLCCRDEGAGMVHSLCLQEIVEACSVQGTEAGFKIIFIYVLQGCKFLHRVMFAYILKDKLVCFATGFLNAVCFFAGYRINIQGVK